MVLEIDGTITFLLSLNEKSIFQLDRKNVFSQDNRNFLLKYHKMFNVAYSYIKQYQPKKQVIFIKLRLGKSILDPKPFTEFFEKMLR